MPTGGNSIWPGARLLTAAALMSSSSISINKVLFPSKRRRVLNFLLKKLWQAINNRSLCGAAVVAAALDDEGLISRRAHTHQPRQQHINPTEFDVTFAPAPGQRDPGDAAPRRRKGAHRIEGQNCHDQPDARQRNRIACGTRSANVTTQR